MYIMKDTIENILGPSSLSMFRHSKSMNIAFAMVCLWDHYMFICHDCITEYCLYDTLRAKSKQKNSEFKLLRNGLERKGPTNRSFCMIWRCQQHGFDDQQTSRNQSKKCQRLSWLALKSAHTTQLISNRDQRYLFCWSYHHDHTVPFNCDGTTVSDARDI